MSETAIALSVTVLTLLGIGIGCAAAWARRHGNVLRAHRLRLTLPAFFFACALLNASHSWQHPFQRLIGVLLGGAFAVVWVVTERRGSRRTWHPVGTARL